MTTPTIRENARNQISAGNIAELDLGCGARKRNPEALGVDALDLPEVDIVGDIFEVLTFLPQNSVQRIYASHFFEHIDDQPALMAGCARVLRPNGTLEVIVPHFSNPFFYSDYTHKRAFGLYSMSYLADDNILRRKVPRYGKASQFELVDVTLTFKSAVKYSIRNVVLRSIGLIVNINRYTQEIYEELFSKFVPCYEVKFVCKKRSNELKS
jgi:ubiquinone/menaquinone biosynthesis C-methylase UbiE